MRQALHTSIKTAGDLAVNVESFVRHLKAENLSDRTVETYTEAVVTLIMFLKDARIPLTLADLHRDHRIFARPMGKMVFGKQNPFAVYPNRSGN